MKNCTSFNRGDSSRRFFIWYNLYNLKNMVTIWFIWESQFKKLPKVHDFLLTSHGKFLAKLRRGIGQKWRHFLRKGNFKLMLWEFKKWLLWRENKYCNLIQRLVISRQSPKRFFSFWLFIFHFFQVIFLLCSFVL
jgi:hypothetical protein